MDQHQLIAEVFARRAEREANRRNFLKLTGGVTAAIAGSTLLSACGGGGNNDNSNPTPPPATTPTTTSDEDILNFALNLEYLEAQFYNYAVTGNSLGATLLTGTGTQGAVTGGRKVNFSDPTIAAYAKEIAGDEYHHVDFLRSALGSAAVAQPAIDISADPNGAFSTAARAAGLVGDGQSFDPYASDENFLLGAFIFEDVGVSAYKGASPLITNSTYLEAAAGILAAEAYHAGLIRTVLYRKGISAPSIYAATKAISDARDRLDGPSPNDQGIKYQDGISNIVPADANGIVRSRNTGEVLDIVYLTSVAATKGGFFPAGVNGTINKSQAN